MREVSGKAAGGEARRSQCDVMTGGREDAEDATARAPVNRGPVHELILEVEQRGG
jgi:hypothetical protein